MPDENLFSEAAQFPCTLVEGDAIAARRVGPKGSAGAAVSLDVFTSEPAYDDDDMVVAAVMLSPNSARGLAAALIEFADQCDGIFTSFFPLGQMAIGDDDA